MSSVGKSDAMGPTVGKGPNDAIARPDGAEDAIARVFAEQPLCRASIVGVLGLVSPEVRYMIA